MLELYQYKSQIRVVKTVLVATGLFVVLLCKASGWSSTTAKADEVAGLFSFAFCSVVFFVGFSFGSSVSLAPPRWKVAHNPAYLEESVQDRRTL